MESVKSVCTNNGVTFSRLFDNVLAYITARNNSDDDDDDLQAVEETIYKILLHVDGNGEGSAEELVAVEEIVYNALLVALAVRDRAAGVAPAPEIRTVAAAVLLVDRATETRGCDVPEPVLETRDESVMVVDGEDLQDRRPTVPLEGGPTACDGCKNDDRDLPAEGDGGKNDARDLPAEGEVETAAPTTVEDSAAAVEPDRPLVVEKTSKPRRRRSTAWKSVRRAALRLFCVR